MRLSLKNRLLSEQTGFTLVEVLVAMVILAIGLLGVAGLQTRSLSGNQGALYRSQAVLYANDVIERMRVNRVQARKSPSEYTICSRYDDSNYGIDEFEDLTECLPVTTLQPALADLQQWKVEVASLPEGDGSVTVSTLGSGKFLAIVIVQWNEKGTVNSVRVDTQL